LNAYSQEGLTAELRQGEILSGLMQYEYDPVTNEGEGISHSFSIVVHQDCDLLRDFEDHKKQAGATLNGVLILQLQTEDEIRPKVAGGDIWKRILRNGEERYHLLPKKKEGSELEIPSLVADFRLIFTMPPREIYRQLNAGNLKRNCVLDPPYREHFQSRFAFYLQRVALPDIVT
jgi:hypothetical protein